VLALIFSIGSVLLIIALTLVVIATSFVGMSYGYQAAEKARFAALVGVSDAILQLDRNNGFCSPAGSPPGCSSSPVTSCNVSVAVTVTANSPAAGEDTILSQATVLNRVRQVKAVVSVNASSSAISVVAVTSL